MAWSIVYSPGINPSVAVAPASAAMLVQGTASNTNKNVTPGVGTLIMTHSAPLVAQPPTVNLSLVGVAPTVTVGQALNGAIVIPTLPIIPATVNDLVQVTFQPFGGNGVYTYSINGPSGGAVAADGTFTYTPLAAATDTFVLTVFDTGGNGGQVTFQVIST